MTARAVSAVNAQGDAVAAVRAALTRAPLGPPLSEEERGRLAELGSTPEGAWSSTRDFMARLATLGAGQDGEYPHTPSASADDDE